MSAASAYVDIKISRKLSSELKKIAKVLIKNRMGNGTFTNTILFLERTVKV